MRRAVERVGHAAIGAAELHIQVAVAHLRTRRDETQRREKDGERVHERDLAGRGKARRRGDHIRLSNAHVEMPLGMRLGENAALGRAGQVGIEHDDILIGIAELGEHSAVYFTNGFSHQTFPPSSCIACS